MKKSCREDQDFESRHDRGFFVVDCVIGSWPVFGYIVQSSMTSDASKLGGVVGGSSKSPVRPDRREDSCGELHGLRASGC